MDKKVHCVARTCKIDTILFSKLPSVQFLWKILDASLKLREFSYMEAQFIENQPDVL